jgi:hypothetical protein
MERNVKFHGVSKMLLKMPLDKLVVQLGRLVQKQQLIYK